MKFKSHFLLSFLKPRRKRQTLGGWCHVGDNGLWLVRQETGWRSLSATDWMFDQEQWFSGWFCPAGNNRQSLEILVAAVTGEMLLALSGWRSGMQFNILQRTAQILPQPLLPKTHLAAKAHGVHVANPRSTGSPFSLGLGFPV